MTHFGHTVTVRSSGSRAARPSRVSPTSRTGARPGSMSPPRMSLQRVRAGVIKLANLLGVIAVVADFQCGGGQERARKLLNREADGARRGLEAPVNDMGRAWL